MMRSVRIPEHGLVVMLVLSVLWGCVRVNVPGGRRTTRARGDLMMIYGAGASKPKERESEIAQHWMTVHVSQSDSTHEFGHLPPRGEFEVHCTGLEGRFRIQGGDIQNFAIRDLKDSTAVYRFAKYGKYELTGPAMPAGRAVFPLMKDKYYSIAILTFQLSRRDTFIVHLVASSPNGFAPVD